MLLYLGVGYIAERIGGWVPIYNELPDGIARWRKGMHNLSVRICDHKIV